MGAGVVLPTSTRRPPSLDPRGRLNTGWAHVRVPWLGVRSGREPSSLEGLIAPKIAVATRVRATVRGMSDAFNLTRLYGER
jgi:hypothetical protein